MADSLLPRVQTVDSVDIQKGAGAPSHDAPKGTLYINTSATTTATRLYINTSGEDDWASFTASA